MKIEVIENATVYSDSAENAGNLDLIRTITPVNPVVEIDSRKIPLIFIPKNINQLDDKHSDDF